MLSLVVLPAAITAAPSLKNAAFLSPGVLQATKIFHTGQPSLAPVPRLPEYGGKVHYGLILEEFFWFLYPKTIIFYIYIKYIYEVWRLSL
uniref:ATP synthase subunit b n=1 Tax=Rhinolophus ferrumequinum TaxID=59479 RepID=A0A671ETF6_RHIFE